MAVQNGGLVDGNAPPWLTTLAEPATKTFGLSVPPTIVIWVVVLILFAILLHRTRLGRSLFATGANSRAADYALISTRRVWTATFAFSAIASALVGVLIGGFAGTVDSALGDPYLFQSVVSVIVGGTVFGGPGDYTRTCVGALFLTVLTTVLDRSRSEPRRRGDRLRPHHPRRHRRLRPAAAAPRPPVRPWPTGTMRPCRNDSPDQQPEPRPTESEG